MKSKVFNILLLFFLVFTTPAFSEEIDCLVVSIIDGDTIICLDTNKQQIRVRLSQIDAPEAKQMFGAAAKKLLAAYVFKKNVVLKSIGTDRYGRTLAEVFVGDSNINKKMVLMGFAWAYQQYVTDQEYIRLENQARIKKIGLWSMPNPIYPQDFRRKFSR